MPPDAGPEYSNPEVPHEVNVSEKTPLRDFARLSLGLCLITVAVTASVYFAARWWAPLIPFHYETALTGAMLDDDAPAPGCRAEGVRALQALVDGLAAKMALPAGMTVRAHFSGDGNPNAFATLGGNIFVNKGLLARLRSENALAMVLAHEIGHVKHRDPIISLGGGVAVAVLFSVALGGTDGGALAGWAMGLTQMSFSRAQEERADAEALAALRAYYGQTNGADEFFAWIVEQYPRMSRLPAFVGTHPTPPARLQNIRGSFSPEARPLTPLPPGIEGLRTCAGA
jgi:Zn-dependent protease with chaperone function